MQKRKVTLSALHRPGTASVLNGSRYKPYNRGLKTESRQAQTRAHAVAVGAGILLSRLVGLARDRVFAHYFGNSDAADAFRAAFRIPNFLQNLFGEGVLSASFIPVYARLNAEDRHEEASQLAEAIFALLAVVTTVLVALGVWATPCGLR